MAISKKLEIIYHNGQPDGIRSIRRHLSTMTTYVVPRPLLSEAKKLSGINRPGIYYLISENDDSDDVHIFIGSENVLDSMTNSSLIYKTVKKDGRVIGAVGVIGPRRMEYSKVIATVENLAKGVSEIIAGEPENNTKLLGDGKSGTDE